MTLQFLLSLLLQYVVFFPQPKGLFCCPLRSPTEDIARSTQVVTSRERPTIFDSRVLNRVKTLFIRSLQLDAAAKRDETGQKKSIIQTADTETPLHVKINPRTFGQKLLNQAEENAARKSDIYMNKAIDATALGVAVLKLIFGKDAKMIMKDAKDSDVTASLRTNEIRPAITSWSIPSRDKMATGNRKSLVNDVASNPRKSDKITQLNLNILKLVKSLRPAASKTEKSRSDEESMLKDKSVKHFGNSEGNLVHLLSLIQEANTKQEKGQKKSWVLLKVPAKQPSDELGMLTDPTRTEENSDESSHEEETEQETHQQEVRQQKARQQVKQHHKINNHKQQSSEGKAITSSISSPLKTLKSEPVQEVNPVKTDATPQVSNEDSVNNLLKALETTHKQAIHRESKHVMEEKSSSSLHHEVKLVPAKKVEEHAASKDVLSGGSNQGGAVVSLDALRQLGQILGLSPPNRISPYTGTQDTLTAASPIAPQALPVLITTPAPTAPVPTIPPTVPPPVATTQSTLKYAESREMSLNRISEQLKMFAERGLRGHNEYRKLHHAMPLKWSEDLASAAEKLAYQAAKKGATIRSELVENKGYGENIAKIPNTMLENAGEEATRHWYNERENFTFSDPGVGEETKAFTQIIWKGTRTLGMGAAKDDDTGELYVVALYNPKGNEEGTLRENIQSDGKQHADVYASIFKKSIAVHH